MKSGIEYFPLDVTLDEKFELIEAEYGLTGFGVVVKLLQRIYGGQGYYIEWTNEVALLFAKRIGLREGGSVVSEIVEASVKRGIFDRTLYEKYRILTSKGIQKRYFEAVSRRKSVSVKRAYLLVGATDFPKNANIFDKNVIIFDENVNIPEQSKVKERKVKESKGEESRVNAPAHTREATPPPPPQEEEPKGEVSYQGEPTPFTRFIERWGIKTRSLSNYSAGKVGGIDWDAISDEVQKSSYLQQQKALSFYIDHANDILDGKYFDFERPQMLKRPRGDTAGADNNRRVYEQVLESIRKRGGGNAE